MLHAVGDFFAFIFLYILFYTLFYLLCGIGYGLGFVVAGEAGAVIGSILSAILIIGAVTTAAVLSCAAHSSVIVIAKAALLTGAIAASPVLSVPVIALLATVGAAVLALAAVAIVGNILMNREQAQVSTYANQESNTTTSRFVADCLMQTKQILGYTPEEKVAAEVQEPTVTVAPAAAVQAPFFANSSSSTEDDLTSDFRQLNAVSLSG